MAERDHDLGPADLDLDLDDPTPQALHRWFLASMLLGAPVRQSQSAETYRVLIERGLTSPSRFAELDREQLRKALDDGGYARLDYQTADRLHATMRAIDDGWGSVNRLVRSSSSAEELSRRVQEFDGIGETTARIFIDPIPASVYGTEAER